MFYCTNIKQKDTINAGSKAPKDITNCLSEIGAKSIDFYLKKQYKFKIMTGVADVVISLGNWTRLFFLIPKNAYVLIQHPYTNFLFTSFFMSMCKKIKRHHFVILIHDLDSLRNNKDTVLARCKNKIADNYILKKSKYVICHNEKMKGYLIKQGIEPVKLFSLEIFDYLHNCVLSEKRVKEKSVIVAGNLDKEKAGYLYELLHDPKREYYLNLYGPNYDEEESEKTNYYGMYDADELPGKLKGAFGLIWDGSSMNTCGGIMGEYLRYNNPHKCSLYLASNIPVIVWKEAAIATFVHDNNVGILVENLYEISDCINNITEEEYDIMMQNVVRVGNKLRKGTYIKTVIENINVM